jgi:hypothetical protein
MMIFAFIADAQRVGQQLAESPNRRLEQILSLLSLHRRGAHSGTAPGARPLGRINGLTTLVVRASSVGGDDDVKFSPDGSRLTIQEHYMVWVINLATGNLERVPSVNWRPWSAFSPDGASLFTISFVGDAVWADFRRRTVITNYTCDHGWCTDRYSSISFDPQMRALGLGTEAGEVILAKLPLWISNIERAGNNLTIQWQGGTGPFQLQGIREITSSTWEDIGPPLMGSTVSLPIDAASAIYRVRDLRP